MSWLLNLFFEKVVSCELAVEFVFCESCELL